MEGTILLADMNSFFASVHQALDPSLRGKPVIMGGENQRSPGAADATVQVTEGKRIIFRSTVSFDKIRQVFS
ncbi:hypothetical protein [Desulfovirgula thermocuniculi]|uniref:Y-family DNA polymerase n=1 Tax=Desulfovirgula thermocuniculi TaxID=348842 RepID=UPI0004048E9D|nr:hypothetical protein [Desulfovirgula thermocuniculi]